VRVGGGGCGPLMRVSTLVACVLQVVDTNGAGDAFCGGFFSGLIQVPKPSILTLKANPNPRPICSLAPFK
jgi:sugar/nucleoside kinase (ribokinase family)